MRVGSIVCGMNENVFNLPGHLTLALKASRKCKARISFDVFIIGFCRFPASRIYGLAPTSCGRMP